METLTLRRFQQTFSEIIDIAKHQPVEIRGDDGTIFVFSAKSFKPTESSPFDVKGIRLQSPIYLDDVVNAVREGRETR